MFAFEVAVISSAYTSTGFSLLIIGRLRSKGDGNKRISAAVRIGALLFFSSALFYSWLNANPRIL